MTSFVDRVPSVENRWRSIILLGRNVASYKFALAKALLDQPSPSSLIRLEDLALPYALNIAEHLKSNDKQATSQTSTFLDNCRKFNAGAISEDELREVALRHGFTHVINAFHNVANSEVPRFFEDARNEKDGIILSDNFFKLASSRQKRNLTLELDARWRLWETAISLDISPRLLEVSADETFEALFVIDGSARRRSVTSSRDALNGYQQGLCFYCSREIMIEPGHEESCDVDHFFPDMLRKYRFNGIDQVWNLVLACKNCNRGRNGKFERIPEISFLAKLHRRNNFYVESHHPLKETILNQTGQTEGARRLYLQKIFNEAADAIPTIARWKPEFGG